MQPGDRENRDLPDPELRVGGEIVVERVAVGPVGLEQCIGEALVDRMRHDQERYREAEEEAQRLDPSHAEMAADIDRPEGQREVDREGAVQQDRAELAAPDQFRPLRAPLHRLEGDVAQAVIEEMQEHIREEDEAAAQPQSAHDRRPAANQLGPTGL